MKTTTTAVLGPAVTAFGLLLATFALGSPASAVPAGRAAPTQAGTLSISVPVSADLGSVVPTATSVTGSLGPVEVVDDRLAADASWQVTVSSSDFTTGGAGPTETLSPAGVGYDPGPATATTGDGTFLPEPARSDLTTAAPAFTHIGGSDANSASWSPTVTFTVGADLVAGTYTGTITHSIA